MGLKNWASKTKGKERRERRWVADADRNWSRFLEGRRRSPIFLYKPGDRDAVNSTQLQDARISYIEE